MSAAELDQRVSHGSGDVSLRIAGRGSVRGPVVRYARKDGRVVARLRCFAGTHVFIVATEIDPVEGTPAELASPGPFSFATEEEAKSFLDEVTLSLEYLGCDVNVGSSSAADGVSVAA